jgi:hypothetical protein
MPSTRRSRRLCVSVDVERYSRWSPQDQKLAQDDLAKVLEMACNDAGLDRSTWERHPGGDGELAVLPRDVDEFAVVNHFVRFFGTHLHRHNRRLNEGARIRVRIAVHTGMVEPAGLGFAGQAPVTVTRLRDCPQVRNLMREHPSADFALVISQQLYEDHVEDAGPEMSRNTFQYIRVQYPEKHYAADAWVYLPRGRSAGGSAGDRESGRGPGDTLRDGGPWPEADPSGRSAVTIIGSDVKGTISGRDTVIHRAAPGEPRRP